jgi:hypothetical protein
MNALSTHLPIDFSQKPDPGTVTHGNDIKLRDVSSMFIHTKLYNENSYQNFIHNFITIRCIFLYISTTNM